MVAQLAGEGLGFLVQQYAIGSLNAEKTPPDFAPKILWKENCTHAHDDDADEEQYHPAVPPLDRVDADANRVHPGQHNSHLCKGAPSRTAAVEAERDYERDNISREKTVRSELPLVPLSRDRLL